MGQTNKGNDMQPDMNQLPPQPNNINFGTKNGNLNQQQPLPINKVPSFSGGSSMIPITQTGGPPQVDGTNLYQVLPNNNQLSGQNKWRPPIHVNAQDPMVSQIQYHHLPPNMVQLTSEPYHPQYPQLSFNGNPGNMYKGLGSTKPSVDYPEQSNMNLGRYKQ